MRRSVFAATFFAAATSTVAAPVLQRCEFGDGQVRTLMVDSGAFPMSLARCSAVSAAAPTAAPVRPLQVSASYVQSGPVETAARVIRSPAVDIGRQWQWYGSSHRSVANDINLAADLPLGARPFSDLVHTASRRYRLDARLLHAIIRVESNGNPRARSKAGALGLMQVMPGTGARYGIRNPAALMQPDVNIDVGARYLSDLSRMFGDRLDLVVAAYNAGEGAVIRYGRAVPPYAETQDYVQRVLGRLESVGRMP
ncbi:lytic transglycosylase domain-containing protein [Xylophilus ampelinus]|nr:lytic transglycosylase domain-containing protein [Xylophilus ampelinus]MCS4510435.1 lytic transglycosylase domain-containing protein [Xylophilus ampelinus]